MQRGKIKYKSKKVQQNVIMWKELDLVSSFVFGTEQRKGSM